MNKCIIRKIYCGEGDVPADTASKKYSRRGKGYECMKRGYGVATWEHKKAQLSINSLQQIPYVGPSYEKKFKSSGVNSIKNLVSKAKKMTKSELNTLIKNACTKANGVVDQKAFNSIVLFLHNRGVKNLPSCKIVKE